MYDINALDFHLHARWICNSEIPCAANSVPPPILPEWSANCMGSLPLHPTINRNAVTASILGKTFQPRDVARTVGRDSLGSFRCTSSDSSKTSKATISTPVIVSLPLDNRVRLITHPAFFLASHIFFPSRENVRHSRVKQNFGWTLPPEYAHSSDALHNRKNSTSSPNHMTRPPSSILTNAYRPCDNNDPASGNLTCDFNLWYTVRLVYPFSYKCYHAMRQW